MNDLQKDELIAAQQRIIAAQQKEIQWYEDLINNPGHNEIDMRLALQITPRKMRQGLIAEAPEKKIYIPALAKAAHASEKTVSKRLKRFEKADVCSYRTAKDPSTGNTRAHLQVMPVLGTPAKIDLQRVDRGGGSTWEDGKRVKRCKDCGSHHLARKIAMQVVCMDCGSPQEEMKTHFKQVNAPDAIVNEGANSQTDTDPLDQGELFVSDIEDDPNSQSDTEPDHEYEDEVMTPNSQTDTDPNGQTDTEANPKTSALYDVNTVVYTESYDPALYDVNTVVYTEVMTPPAELQALKQWVVWRYQENPGKPKPKKVPYTPWGRVSQMAKSNDSSTWGTYEQAKRMYDEAIKHNMKTRWDGIGFMFANGYTGIDIDGCVKDGQVDMLAWERIQAIYSYAELSPSGTGVHVIAKGNISGGRNLDDIEMYDTGRYFTWTGQHIIGTPITIEASQERLTALYEEITPTVGATTKEPKPANHCVHAWAGTRTDDEILGKAKSNATTGEKFIALWDGDTTGYKSQSEADMALCGMLAYWTDYDAAAIDRLFRKSGLYREKWDRAARRGDPSYGAGTIGRVLGQCNVA